MTALLARLAFAGMRTRLLATALTVLLAATAAATIVLALEVGQTARVPWKQTFEAAHGAHVLVNVPTEGAARTARSRQGVVEAAAPVPETTVELHTDNGPEPVRISGLSQPPRVNAPVPIAGTATPGDGIVLERSLASALGLEVGERLTFAGEDGAVELPVVGTAVVPSVARYPAPTLAWRGSTGRRSTGCSRAKGSGGGRWRSAWPTPGRQPRSPAPSWRTPRRAPSAPRRGRSSERWC
jgi:putative ABC transport system permease protein